MLNPGTRCKKQDVDSRLKCENDGRVIAGNEQSADIAGAATIKM
jgi:hypothetical protein